MNKRTMKKGLTLVLALVMVFAMSSVAFATTNLTAASNAMYHNFATIVTAEDGSVSYTNASGTAITSFTVAASQAGSYWQAIGFNSQADAQAVSWTSSDTSIATVASTGTAVNSVSGTAGTYDSQTVVTLVGTEAGSCTIQANYDGGSVNFTVVLEKSNSSSATVNNVRVIAEDYDTNRFFNDESGLTVNKASSGSVFYGQAQAAQSFATAGTALEKFANLKGYSLSVGYNGSYVESVNGVGPDGNYVNGWNYCVMRQNTSGTWEIAADSLVIGAGEYKVKAGDVVYWVYAPYADVAQYNEAKCIELNS